MAQNNSFRTRRRRLNSRRSTRMAEMRQICTAYGIGPAAHETLRSAWKRHHDARAKANKGTGVWPSGNKNLSD